MYKVALSRNIISSLSSVCVMTQVVCDDLGGIIAVWFPWKSRCGTMRYARFCSKTGHTALYHSATSRAVCDDPSVVCDDPGGIPAVCDDPGGIPAVCDDPGGIPAVCDDPGGIPAVCDDPGGIPAVCDDPSGIPAVCDDPGCIPAVCDDPGGIPAVCDDPVGVAVQWAYLLKHILT